MRALVAAVVLLAAGPALAQQPRVLPTSDVSVVYRVSGAAGDVIPGGIPGSVRLEWSAREQRLRVEPEGRTQTLLVDLRAPSVEAVDSGLHTALSLPVRPADLENLTLQGAQLTRRGRSVVAGQACTEYAVQSRRGHGTVCVTEGGVVVRAAGEVDGREGGFTAISVSYGTLAPELFEVPPGYMRLSLARPGRRQ